MKQRAARPNIVPGGAQTFHRIYTRLGCQGRPPHFVVNFYPYANLMHTIRVKEESAEVRLCDALRGAPLEIFEATAAILLSRLYRRRAPQELLAAYRRYTIDSRTRRRVNRLRRTRGRIVKTGPRGKTYDLAEMFGRLNRKYFRGRLRQPRLGWSTRSWRAQFGCFDPALNQIVMNQWLDRAAVPAYVVEYVLFHEMLHVKHPLRAARCGLQAHSTAFRQEEKQYTHYERARRFLDR
jgi:Protein of unknown function DUF45